MGICLDALGVGEDERLKVYPLPYCLHAGVRAVLPLPRLVRNIVSESSVMHRGICGELVAVEKGG